MTGNHRVMDINELHFYKKFFRNSCLFLIFIIFATLLCWQFSPLLIDHMLNANREILNSFANRYQFSFTLITLLYASLLIPVVISCSLLLPSRAAIKQFRPVIESLNPTQAEALKQADQESYTNNRHYLYIPNYLLIQKTFYFRLIELNKVDTLQLTQVGNQLSLYFPGAYSKYRVLKLTSKDDMRHVIELIKHDKPNITVLNEECLIINPISNNE